NITTKFKESVIRDMTRVAMRHNAVNMGQGFPDFAPPQAVLDAAVNAIQGGINQYTVTWGYPPLREKIAEVYSPQLGWDIDPNVNVTVTCGVTEAIVAAQIGILDPGDEIIIVEPAHENFYPAALMAGATPVPFPLLPPAFELDYERLSSYVTPKTRALLINTPQNPTGRVFNAEEMAGVAKVVIENDLMLITDEIYNHILYDGRTHIPPGSMEGLQDRTITISGMGKTYAITGWRLGYIIAPEPMATGIRKIHDFISICAPTPLQAAAVEALSLPASFYEQQNRDYAKRRDIMMGYLEEVGMTSIMPEGAYYTMADYSQLQIPQASMDELDFAMWMTTEVGVAVVPGNSFYTESENRYTTSTVRFAFPKKLETLHEAGRRMKAKMLA
ncbi:MAG: aminotransferase class I/II-fold pyridoxal phosphate-dependent enzyme, partial [Chloroflexota bacterium]